ncbi:hypothetical protein WH216_15840 [Xanthomonas perforans]|uniref:Uncharacterized protein n=1 Tax=Xanthomonas perforans TaxID=442694 RepID=A0A6P0E376_XANPE|nr:hypothetical protein [Xanthomonas perforans]MBZ2604920.1 hypothetical protein [Xanthomonas perforans]MBZ2746646.1 hypothetical protein [Xanthomonas perforans]MBZ3075089.1 hypothetical protein [Xanthomonas perforans]MBZ3144456.1 hypothetical protein [Xanthomonas perforans]MBZ3151998.1 hypothetical protein [Xanthomonas perforans]
MNTQFAAETVLGFTDLQLKFGTAAGQLGLATAVAYVAWQQWRTARNKLKSDLFERRFKLVKELRYRASRVAAHSAKAEEILSLPDLAREAGFLFNKQIKDTSERLIKALNSVDSRQALLKDQHGMIKLQKEQLVEAHSLATELRDERIKTIQTAQETTTSDLQQINSDLKVARAQVNKELKALEEATAKFLTLRH